jgi:hypothetical protein
MTILDKEMSSSALLYDAINYFSHFLTVFNRNAALPIAGPRRSATEMD